MASQEPRLLNSLEVAEKLGVCRSTAYSIIKELNKEMERRGCKVIAGRVSSDLIDETYFQARKDA